jgi:hypothetical protein
VTQKDLASFFLVERERGGLAPLAEAARLHVPEARVWRFRDVIDAGGQLLRCIGSELPDALVISEPYDDWSQARLEECLKARRDLIAVAIILLDNRAAPHSFFQGRLDIRDTKIRESRARAAFFWRGLVRNYGRYGGALNAAPALEHSGYTPDIPFRPVHATSDVVA